MIVDPNVSCAMNKEQTLSICMIVKDEEKNLEACIESFKPVADEIIVVDTGSTDRTVAVANQLASKVIHSQWRHDFSYSRNISLEHATGDWCMWIDADDRLPAYEIEKMKALKRVETDRAFSFRVVFPMAGGFDSQVLQVRMFPRDDNIRFRKPIHEEIVTSLRQNNYDVFSVDIKIEHTGYADDALQGEKAVRNLEILSANLPRYGQDPNYLSQMGDAFSVIKEHEKAIDSYKKAFKLPACKEEAMDLFNHLPVRIAREYREQKDYDKALAWLDQALEIDPDSVLAFYLRGRIWEELGRVPETIQVLEKVVSLPERLDACLSTDKIARAKAHILLGRLERKRGDTERAKTWFLAAVEEYPTIIDSYYELGDIFLEDGALHESVHWFGKSLAMSRSFSPVPLIGMAKICGILEKPKQKRVFLEELTAYFPGDEDVEAAVKALSQ